MPREAKPLPLPLVKPGSHPPPGFRAMLIRRTKLKYPEMSESAIARKVGCAPSNVHRVLKLYLSDYSQRDLEDYHQNRANILDSLQLRILRSITDEDIRKASLKDRMIAFGIAYDKARLENGQATSINMNVILDAVNAARELQAQRSREAVESRTARLACRVPQT
jgi:hypothetical protein